MKLYAASVYARKNTADDFIIRHFALVVIARNTQEARGIALDKSEVAFPIDLGWTAHSVGVAEVSQDTLDRLKHAD